MARLTRITIIIAYLIYLVAVYQVYVQFSAGISDFSIYYHAAEAIAMRQNPYEILPGYLYPPLLAQVLAPFTVITTESTTELIWFIFNAGILILGLGILSQHIPEGFQRSVFWLTALLFLPVFHTFYAGQVSFILLTALVGAWLAYRKGNTPIVGICLAVAAWIKVYPAFVVAYFLWKREFRVVMWVLITSIVLVLFQIAVSGFDVFISFFTVRLPSLASEGLLAQDFLSNSILSFSRRLFLYTPFTHPLIESQALFTIVRYGLTALILVPLLLTLRPSKLKDTPKNQFDIEYSMVVMASLLLGATLHALGTVPVLLVFVILYHQNRQSLIGLLGAFLLINAHLLIVQNYTAGEPRPVLLFSMPFFGMLILWGMLIARLRVVQSSTGQI